MTKGKIRRNRGVFAGYDPSKIVAIWKVMAEYGDFLHVAEIARRANMNQVTVRWYLDKYLKQMVEERRLAPSIRFRAVKLKPNADLPGLLRSLEFIRSVKKERK
jgi:hypothetical protein